MLPIPGLLLCAQVQLTVPFSRTTFSTTASFEVRSPKRLQLRLTKGGIQVGRQGKGAEKGVLGKLGKRTGGEGRGEACWQG